MQLTRFTDLGLRMLMYLSQQPDERPITIAEVASQFNVPHNHLIKVANRLGKMGLVHAVRGRNGGLSLAPMASTMPLGDMLKGLEGDSGLVNCAEPPCALNGKCQLNKALHGALQAFYASLNEYTLADVTGGRTATVLIELHRDYRAAHPH